MVEFLQLVKSISTKRKECIVYINQVPCRILHIPIQNFWSHLLSVREPVGFYVSNLLWCFYQLPLKLIAFSLTVTFIGWYHTNCKQRSNIIRKFTGPSARLQAGSIKMDQYCIDVANAFSVKVAVVHRIKKKREDPLRRSSPASNFVTVLH